MANFNKVILAGNLTRDPQLSYMPSGSGVCEFGMAINRKWRTQNGEMKDDVCFVDLRAFGKQAETLNQYMNKGKPILVEGRLKFDQWEGKDGAKRSKLYVVVENFQFLGAPGGERSGGGGGGGYRQTGGTLAGTGPCGGIERHGGPAADPGS
jgi:single-strand DNA-binding protein